MSFRDFCPLVRSLRQAGVVFSRRRWVMSGGRKRRRLVAAWFPLRVLEYMEAWHVEHDKQVEERLRARKAIRALVRRVGK